MDSCLTQKQVLSPISIFGPVEQFVLFHHFPSLIEIHENFQKRSMRNRTIIMSGNGKLMLSIPLVKGKTHQNIKDVRISYEEDWQKDYTQAVRSAYGNSPYFDYYFSTIEKIITSKNTFLFDLWGDGIQFLNSVLTLKEIAYTKSWSDNYDNSFDIRTYSCSQFVNVRKYIQVFNDRFDFMNNLSILDLLFNMGPESSSILTQSEIVNINSL